MKKSFMNNIKHFVDSNVRQRIDRVAHNNNEFFTDDMLLAERHFEDIRQACVELEKRISNLLQSIQATPALGAYTHNVQAGLNNLSQNIVHATGSGNDCLATGGEATSKSNQLSTTLHSNKSPFDELMLSNNNQSMQQSTGSQKDFESAQQLSNDIQHRHKKLPIVGFLKFLLKSSHGMKPDSLLVTTFSHCSQLQSQLTKLYLSHEQTIESQCLKPIQHMLEIDIPNVVKLRKSFIKSHNDLESIKAKYNGASQKQQQQLLQAGHFTSTSYTITQTSTQQANIAKIDQLKKELDEAESKFDQAKVSSDGQNNKPVIARSHSRTVIRACERELSGIIPALEDASSSISASTSVNTCKIKQSYQ